MGTEGRLQARTKKLHAMKKFLSAVATAALSLFAQAQNTDAPMATLQHGDQTRVWMGVDAFIKAYEAAADSADVITLSSGNFRVPNEISKSFRLYGAGCEDDPATGTKATVLNSSLQFIPADITNEDGETVKAGRKVNGLHLEGVQVPAIFLNRYEWTPVENLTITKCKIEDCRFNIHSKNVTIKQSVITGQITASDYYLCYNNLLVINSYITGFGTSSVSSESTVHIDHCIVKQQIPVTVLCTNSILYNPLQSGSTSKNNIFVGTASIGNGVQDSNNNWTGIANAGVYAAEGEDGTYAEDKTFELKYPKKYVGTDGTEIGLYGGNYPWNKIPCTPRIMESNIDTKTSADGKLKVSIKVEAQTKD